MIESHQRILMDTELLTAAREGDESRFAHILGLEEDTSEIIINIDNRCIARDEPDFLLGVTYTGNSLLHQAASSNFLGLAEKIWRRETSLLVPCNKVLESPLHCAAENGNHKMISLLLSFAYEMGDKDIMVMEEVLRAQNKDWDCST
ncbi:Ankyrin repeats (3 copies) [Carex littledalei]|uniref:Ankyrin repeats (3 copies) n=1 Tax=Carex littledalei TaxID=544730 RepID=A0A833R9E5_9POAL|nr:Ankyrin repeats (3 copies) [Carex littledalei]